MTNDGRCEKCLATVDSSTGLCSCGYNNITKQTEYYMAQPKYKIKEVKNVTMFDKDGNEIFHIEFGDQYENGFISNQNKK